MSWQVSRIDSCGTAHGGGAGTITAEGLYTAPSGAIPAAPVKLGTLSSLTPVIDLGVFDGVIGCYRLLAVTPAGAALTTPVTIEAVDHCILLAKGFTEPVLSRLDR